MIDQQTFEQLCPLAYQWAKEQEEFILARGFALEPRALDDAMAAGVKDPARVRILVMDRIPFPSDAALAEAARYAHIITDSSHGVTIGYGIIIRADRWGDRELLVHNLVHVAQCERIGGLEIFVKQYLCDRRHCADFTVGALEEEARCLAREVCAAQLN